MTTTRDAPAPAPARAARATREPAAASAREARRYVVLYDRECAFCTASARHLRRWDRRRRMEMIPLQDAHASADPAVREVAITRPLAQALHVVDRETGHVEVGGRAVLTLLDALPGGPLLRPWTALPATTAIAEVAYGVVSDRRQDLGWAVGVRHEVACPVHGEASSAARR
jgi:predicted DCC family thiol-disulfide oxidoreductase YuxK